MAQIHVLLYVSDEFVTSTVQALRHRFQDRGPILKAAYKLLFGAELLMKKGAGRDRVMAHLRAGRQASQKHCPTSQRCGYKSGGSPPTG